MMTDPNETTGAPCPICQGNGTRGQMQGGNRMAVIDCEVCGGTGVQKASDPIKTTIPDAEFIDGCERDSLGGRALDPNEMERLFRLSGHDGDLPNYRLAYPPLWEMIEDAKRRRVLLLRAIEPMEAEIVAGRLAADAAWMHWTGGRSPLDGMEVFVREALRAAAKVRSEENG